MNTLRSATAAQETLCRLAKVNKLVDTIDALATSQGLNPFAQSAKIAEMVRGLGAGNWIALANVARCNVPSPVTIDWIRKTYERRAQALSEVA